MQQLVKGAGLTRGAEGWFRTTPGATAADRFRQRQLAAWRESTGREHPGVVTLAVNGEEFDNELAARRALKASVEAVAA